MAWLRMAAVIAAACWIVACGGEAPSRRAVTTATGAPEGETRTAMIGAEGGTLASADGVLTIVVPAGALASSVSLSVVAISNEAPGGLGVGYRISPEGLTLAVPAELTFTWTDAELVGSHPDALGIGFQDADGYWVPVAETMRDDAARTIRAHTTHFSDWTRLLGYQLRPGSATVSTGASLGLELVWCAPVDVEAELVALSPCAPVSEDEGLSAEDWAVNGVAGGGDAQGRVERLGDGAARYVAPTTAPEPALVAVSAQVVGALGRVLVVSNVRVESGGGGRYTGTLLASRATVESASPANGFFSTVRAEIDAVYDPALDDYRFSGTALVESFSAVSTDLTCTASSVEVPFEGFLYLREDGTYGFAFGGEVDADTACNDAAMTVLPYTLNPLAQYTTHTEGCTGDEIPLRYDDPSVLTGSYDYECDLTSMLEQFQGSWTFERR